MRAPRVRPLLRLGGLRIADLLRGRRPRPKGAGAVRGGTSFTPKSAAAETLVTASLTFDEPLQGQPTLVVEGQEAAERFELVFPRRESPILSVGSLVLDPLAPVISGLVIQTPSVDGYANLQERNVGASLKPP